MNMVSERFVPTRTGEPVGTTTSSPSPEPSSVSGGKVGKTGLRGSRSDTVSSDWKCDACGSLEVYYFYQDLEEKEPVTDRKGVLWATFEPVENSQHYGCIEHPVRGGRVYHKESDGITALERQRRKNA
jgi:hypothetical protein